jgi:hypothetical protein
MKKGTSINRREMLRLTSAVAALGAGLGIVLKPGQSWAQPVESSKVKIEKPLWTYQMKFYQQGSTKPVFSAEIPEATAKQILGLEREAGAGPSLDQINVKLERMSTQTNQVELMGETILKLPARSTTKQAILPAGSK